MREPSRGSWWARGGRGLAARGRGATMVIAASVAGEGGRCVRRCDLSPSSVSKSMWQIVHVCVVVGLCSYGYAVRFLRHLPEFHALVRWVMHLTLLANVVSQLMHLLSGWSMEIRCRIPWASLSENRWCASRALWVGSLFPHAKPSVSRMSQMCSHGWRSSSSLSESIRSVSDGTCCSIAVGGVHSLVMNRRRMMVGSRVVNRWRRVSLVSNWRMSRGCHSSANSWSGKLSRISMSCWSWTAQGWALGSMVPSSVSVG